MAPGGRAGNGEGPGGDGDLDTEGEEPAADEEPNAGRAAYAVAWSGGKDSTLALHRARTRGYPVTHLFNVYEGSSGRVRFHGVRRELIAAQATALELELVQEATGPGDFEAAFTRALDRLEESGVRGVVFGNIHLSDIRGWYEERTTGRGLSHVEPLWGGEPAGLVREFVMLGYRARVVSVMLESGDPAWVGRELKGGILREIVGRPGVDSCGEHGEYHTFVWDGPLFGHPVRARAGETVEIEGHRLLDLLPGEEGS